MSTVERPLEQPVRLRGAAPRRDVIRLLEEDRIDVMQLDEVFQFDRGAPLGSCGLDLLGFEHRESSRFDLVSPHEVTECEFAVALGFAAGRRRAAVGRCADSLAQSLGLVRAHRLPRRLQLVTPFVISVLGNPTVAHASPLPIEEVEADVLRARGRVQRDRDRHQSERHSTRPHGPPHDLTLPQGLSSHSAASDRQLRGPDVPRPREW